MSAIDSVKQSQHQEEQRKKMLGANRSGDMTLSTSHEALRIASQFAIIREQHGIQARRRQKQEHSEALSFLRRKLKENLARSMKAK